jgi:hypothetical protein
MVVQTAQPPRRLALYVGCCNEHRVIQSGRALRPLTDATTSHQIEVNAAVRARSIVGCDYQSRERRKGIQTGHWRPESRLLVAATRRGHPSRPLVAATDAATGRRSRGPWMSPG